MKKPSNKISLMREDDESVYFQAECSCGHGSCGLYLEKLDHNDKIYAIVLQFEYEVRKATFWERIKFLFKGCRQTYESFIFDEKEQIQHYIDALQYGLNKLDIK